MRRCADCTTILSAYNKDKRNLCYKCIKIIDIDVIRSPATECDETRRVNEMRRAVNRSSNL